MVMYKDSVQVIEGRADSAPRLIGSFNFSELTVSGTAYKQFRSVLSRNAKARTFIFNNTLNQPTTAAPSFFAFDSTVGTAPVFSSTLSGGAIPSNSQLYDTSERTALLTAHVDSCQIGIGMGATLPTSGKIDVYVVEFF